jgi:excisionase family DNA binding protein
MTHTAHTITQSEAARRLGVSRPRIHQMIGEGAIATAITADGLRLIPLAEIARLLSEREAIRADGP